MTQDQLAELLGVSQKHISEVERGEASFSLSRMIEVAKLLDTGLDYLILGKVDHGYLLPLPNSVDTILRSGREDEVKLLIEYMEFYVKLRENEQKEKE